MAVFAFAHWICDVVCFGGHREKLAIRRVRTVPARLVDDVERNGAAIAPHRIVRGHGVRHDIDLRLDELITVYSAVPALDESE